MVPRLTSCNRCAHRHNAYQSYGSFRLVLPVQRLQTNLLTVLVLIQFSLVAVCGDWVHGIVSCGTPAAGGCGSSESHACCSHHGCSHGLRKASTAKAPAQKPGWHQSGPADPPHECAFCSFFASAWSSGQLFSAPQIVIALLGTLVHDHDAQLGVTFAGVHLPRGPPADACA